MCHENRCVCQDVQLRLGARRGDAGREPTERGRVDLSGSEYHSIVTRQRLDAQAIQIEPVGVGGPQ